jgi:hypothetical protein
VVIQNHLHGRTYRMCPQIDIRSRIQLAK